jgi:hypothetical protein
MNALIPIADTTKPVIWIDHRTSLNMYPMSVSARVDTVVITWSRIPFANDRWRYGNRYLSKYFSWLLTFLCVRRGGRTVYFLKGQWVKIKRDNVAITQPRNNTGRVFGSWSFVTRYSHKWTRNRQEKHSAQKYRAGWNHNAIFFTRERKNRGSRPLAHPCPSRFAAGD